VTSVELGLMRMTAGTEPTEVAGTAVAAGMQEQSMLAPVQR
jgi:hypothetical protein